MLSHISCICTHSSIHGYLSCFQPLAIVNHAAVDNVAVDRCVGCLSESSFSSFGYLTSGGVAGSYDNFEFRFEGCLAVFTASASFYVPRAAQRSSSLHPCQHLMSADFFDYSHPDGCEMGSHCVFICVSLKKLMSRASFHVLADHLCYRL